MTPALKDAIRDLCFADRQRDLIKVAKRGVLPASVGPEVDEVLVELKEMRESAILRIKLAAGVAGVELPPLVELEG